MEGNAMTLLMAVKTLLHVAAGLGAIVSWFGWQMNDGCVRSSCKVILRDVQVCTSYGRLADTEAIRQASLLTLLREYLH